MARPSKLTAALLDTLEPIAQDAWSVREACAAIGVTEGTWRRWETSANGDELHVRFRELAERTRAASGLKVDELAWGVLRRVMEDESARDADRIAAAATALRLRNAQRVELTGRDGQPLEAAADHAATARARLKAGLDRLAPDELRELHSLTVKMESGDAAA